MKTFWKDFFKERPGAAACLSWALSAAAGLILAVVLHYVFYRIGLPSKPFIYVAF
jgi:hypothetical protein